MASEARTRIRCAIYTRKSSEEGLEQSFNSLDAQREACEAYIASQRHEGWQPINTRFDDGGYSGGTMDRPALKELLADIAARKVDAVVVYKVDRLTRSLADFAKIIEIFDAHKVSFVSVTQQFNTTGSMGRLTLNVLLSFAQFEREVTGERIRDKIAASKRKGLWMGGNVPSGYRVENRKLVVDPAAAERIREIFRQYLKVNGLTELKVYLDNRGVLTERRTSASGRQIGGARYSRGALHRLLKNRVYIGEISHKGTAHSGLHDPIVPRAVWDQVQDRLQANHHSHRIAANAREPSLLVGLVWDQQGRRYTPSHSVKGGKRYRYYILRPPSKNSDEPVGSMRLPASVLETAVITGIRAFFQSPERIIDTLRWRKVDPAIRQQIETRLATLAQSMKSSTTVQIRSFLRLLVARVVVHSSELEVRMRKQEIHKLLGKEHAGNSRMANQSLLTIRVDAQFVPRGGQKRLVLTPKDSKLLPEQPDAPLIKSVARAHDWVERLISKEFKNQRTIAKHTGLDERYVSRILECAWLAPSIVESITDGRQPAGLTLDNMVQNLSSNWSTQQARLGFA